MELSPELHEIVPQCHPGMTVPAAMAFAMDRAEANKRPDKTECQSSFAHPDLADLPALCQTSLLVHGHREGLVRFRKLLFACKGFRWAFLEEPSEVNAITEAAFEKLRSTSREQADTYVKAMAELYRKKEDLLSTKDAPPMDDVQAYSRYLCQKQAKVETVFAEESQAAALYVQFMLPRRITD